MFLEARLRPLADPDRLLIQPGLRMVSASIGGGPFSAAFDPRIAVRWAAWDSGTLKAGTGLHHQPPQDNVLAFSGEDGLGFERTWSGEVGIEQNLGEHVSVDLTGFWRQTDRRFVANPDFVDPDVDTFFVPQGRGRARGAEILLRKNPIGPLSGWVSYTLSRSERLDHPDDPDAEWVLFDFDQTHILTGTASYRFPYDLLLGSRVQYVTGNPTTPYAGGVVDLDSAGYAGVAGEENSERLSPYWTVDLRLSKRWTAKRWRLQAFVDLLNIVHGDNPEGEIFNYDYTESALIEGLPFIPSVGFEADLTF